MKSISVIIPCFNARSTIAKTIESLWKQKIPFKEVLIIDDCSTDDTVLFLKNKYKNKIRILKNKKNSGAALSRNVGMRAAKGDLVLLIDSDVVMEKNALRNMLEKLEKNQIVFPYMIYENGGVMYPNNLSDEKYLLISPCFIITKEGLSRLNNNLFDENLKIYCEDTDFFLRCFLVGLTCAFVKEAVIVHKTNKKNFREDRYFLELRNSFYGFIKFYGFKLQAFDHAFRVQNILQLLACGFFNFNLFDAQINGYDKSKPLSYKIRKLFYHEEKITDKGFIFILYLTGKAFIEFLKISPSAFFERKILISKINNKNFFYDNNY